jgi:hypothetical protein
MYVHPTSLLLLANQRMNDLNLDADREHLVRVARDARSQNRRAPSRVAAPTTLPEPRIARLPSGPIG